jgi:hypothetical protein
MIEMLVISSNAQNLFSNSSATRGIPLFFSGNGANTAIFMIGYKLDSIAVNSGWTLLTEICTTKNVWLLLQLSQIILEPDEQVVKCKLSVDTCNGFAHLGNGKKTRLIVIE